MRIPCRIISLLMIVLIAACGQTPQTDNSVKSADKPPAYGDILVRGDIGDASNLIPILASDSPSHSVASMVYNGLVKYDKDMNIVWKCAKVKDVLLHHVAGGEQKAIPWEYETNE